MVSRASEAGPQPSGATAIAAAVLALLGGCAAVLGIAAFVLMIVEGGFDRAFLLAGVTLSELGWWGPYLAASQLANAVTAVLLISGAVALLKKKRSGQTWIVIGCLLVIVAQIAAMAATAALLGSVSAILDPAIEFGPLVQNAMVSTGIFTIVTLLFPILTLVLAASPSTTRWCETRSGQRSDKGMSFIEVSSSWAPPRAETISIDSGGTRSDIMRPSERPGLVSGRLDVGGAPPWPDVAVLRAKATVLKTEIARGPRAHVLCDGAAIALMLVALWLPWNHDVARARLSVAPDLAAVIGVTTVLAIVGVAWPYLAQAHSADSSPWHSWFRTIGVSAYLITAVVVIVTDVVRSLLVLVDTPAWSRGVGPGVWFALTGGLLALYWRQPQDVASRNAKGALAPLHTVMTSALVLGGLAVLFAVTSIVLGSSVGMVAVGPLAADSLHAIAGVVAVSLPAIILVLMAVIGVRWDPGPWCLTLAGVCGAVLLAGLLRAFSGSQGIEYFHSGSYYAMPLWAAAGAMAVAVLARAPRAVGGGHRGYTWLAACRYLFALVGVWSFGRAVLFVLLEALDVGYLLGPGVLSLPQSIVLAAFGVATGLLAVVGMASLQLRYSSGEDPRPPRHFALVCAAGVVVMTVGRILVADAVGGAGRILTMDYVALGLVVAVAGVLLFAPPVRDLYAGMPLFPASASARAFPQSGADADLAAASDPRTSRRDLARIARSRPDLRPAVASNPAAYGELIAWLESVGDSENHADSQTQSTTD
ncbi:hypothetical protein ONR57_12955 [Hoyosella sp. YIM 151337]|uniref:DUF7937 domain-containing protein n=1 Tax=Hoyosella sp. YIM 151337 TaxID=2992742 RepID=UPI002235D6F1|nr:hypothetical protein [Hoyosella sp. YIM 151337]MCW4354209.1 hypothetical protein [Hoyosella sp. YIM 151337]